eukprot:GHVS01059147.1.p2 GENE.GHVS01059147.1~~GHVS01059147.1.p2  ORF type:complete len:123 (-),score=12.14 GHVS01059147.1:426-794(-)
MALLRSPFSRLLAVVLCLLFIVLQNSLVEGSSLVEVAPESDERSGCWRLLFHPKSESRDPPEFPRGSRILFEDDVHIKKADDFSEALTLREVLMYDSGVIALATMVEWLPHLELSFRTDNLY